MLPGGPYKSAETEKEVLDYWIANKLYSPEYQSDDVHSTAYISGEDKRERYANILPPPNANGNLHLGHMSGYAYQDLMGRYQRMRGKKVLLLPGKDHAGIQTEVVFERELEAKGVDKKSLGREEFYKQCYEFCMNCSEIARNQEKNLGLAADFDRELFTLDPRIVDEVLQTFVDMYHDKLIYRDKRLINWCVRCQSALADIDTEYKESEAKFVYFKYAFTEPNQDAIKLKNDYQRKEIEWTFERSKTSDGEQDLNFHFGHDSNGVEIIGLGYSEDLTAGQKVKGKVIGLQMRLGLGQRLVVLNSSLNEPDPKQVDAVFHFEIKYYAGAHFIFFDKYNEDKFFTDGFVIGTVRQETIFGDTALAVSPDDERYAQFVDKTFTFQTVGRTIDLKIIADRKVDPTFGTGVLKVTPAHSKDDWDIASRHKEVLPEKQVVNFDGKLNHLTGRFEGMSVKEGREAIISDMQNIGMMVHIIEKYKNSKQICERCKHQIEPLISYQWFLNTKPLKEKAKQLVLDGFTKILPDGKESVYLNWMDQPEDWCITRQLWWGYRVPVWFKQKAQEYITETGEVKEKIGDKIINSIEDYGDMIHVGQNPPGEGWIQDEDVLDTWFSSGQWPIVTLLARGEDAKEYYPTQVMETGWDILIFWVTRMMLLCPYKAEKTAERRGLTQEQMRDELLTPFKTVYLHGLVLDKNGVKMSKSKGNGIDPFEMMSKYGTDALRLSFVVGNKAGQNYRLYEEKIEGFRNYCNKIWNISKFALMNIENAGVDLTKFKLTDLKLESDDQEMINHIHSLVADTTERMENFNFGIAAHELYQSVWHEFADKYLEQIKTRVFTKDREGNPINTSPEEQESRKVALWTLWYCLDKYLRLLHPFVPFITERIWKELPKVEGESQSLMYAKWGN